MKWTKKRKIIAVGLGALVIVGIMAFDVRLKTVVYTIKSNKVDKEITIGLIADLHSCNYGENQKTLTDAVAKSNPDVILLAGDIIDDVIPRKKAGEFLEWSGKHYPSFYVTGNHEYWTGAIDKVRQYVRDFNVTVLEGDTALFDKDGQPMQIMGINDREDTDERWNAELKQVGESIEADKFSVLVTHRPEEINRYLEYDFDLVVAGHAHGGQWRLPGVINGLLAPNQGLFPKYAGGRYDFDKTTFIVSRGLARESTRVPRIFNRPEYVVIKVVPE